LRRSLAGAEHASDNASAAFNLFCPLTPCFVHRVDAKSLYFERNSSSFFSVQASTAVQSPCSVQYIEQGLRLHSAVSSCYTSGVRSTYRHIALLPSLAKRRGTGRLIFSNLFVIGNLIGFNMRKLICLIVCWWWFFKEITRFMWRNLPKFMYNMSELTHERKSATSGSETSVV
jgi:hypothetical protein